MSYTTKCILNLAQERDTLNDHARAMYVAILNFRKCKELQSLKALRATNEYAELCRVWKEFDTVINVQSHKDMLDDVVPRSEWH